ncbi:MAG: M48 family metalloprotease [Myxococcota bacterium]
MGAMGAVVGLTLTSCGDGLGGFLISDQQEVELGAGVDTELRGQYKIAAPTDPATVWMQGFIGKLVDASTRFRDPADIGGYKVAVIVDDELVNAFAAPGGFTYISTGLILQAQTCAEIAGVMGHELAHVTERHGVKQIEDTYAVSIVSGWFLGDGLANDVAATVYNFLQSTQFSQEHEAEADLIGLQISHDAGYNPYGLVDFFTKLLALEGDSAPPKFLSSHPPTQERIDDASKEIEKRYGDTVNPGTTQTYECVGTALTLENLKAHIRSGVEVTPGTGENPPAQ